MIELKHVKKSYSKNGDIFIHAVQDATITIRQGEFVAIMGPSGSGKTTLMNLMGLLDRPDDGVYLLNGKKVSDFSVDELAKVRNRKIGFVFQSFYLLPRTSALENVELPLVYSDRSDIKHLAKQALDSVGLSGRSGHTPRELSGGEQQRVAIARALVNEPDILFADEPTGNLDTKSGAEIMAIFLELNSRGKTVVLITHEQSIAEHAHRIIKIMDGKITDDDNVVSRRNAKEEL